jgi:hypothetical protein
MRDRYARAFAGERADPTWAESAQRRADERLKVTAQAGSTVRAIECRTSLCRIETTHPDRESAQQFVRGSFMKPGASPWNAPVFSMPLDPAAAGPVVLVSYLAREGHPLPPPN